MQWYYAIGDQRHGPVDQGAFDRLVADRVIEGRTLVWREGMADWQKASLAEGVSGLVADDGTEMCAVSGRRYPRLGMVRYEGKWISAEHRDAFFQGMRERIAQPSPGINQGDVEQVVRRYGGFWRRGAARLIDGLAQGLITLVVAAVVALVLAQTGLLGAEGIGTLIAGQIVGQLLSSLACLWYEVFFIQKYQATPGKMALGLKIVRTDGTDLSVSRIIGRYLGSTLSAITLGIGFIIAAFDAERRTLHDRLADTRVIRKD
ncbi:MAG: hypothetical protein RL077_4803 [Verrucomicrobiota bacterium]|jgi:uncharacterized RDD family membrane protein YckC